MCQLIPMECSAELLVVFGAVFVATYWLYGRHNSSENDHKTPPSMCSLPIIGSLPFMPAKMKDLAAFCINPQKNKLGKVFSFRAGSLYFLVISGRHAIREALVTKSVPFADRPEFLLDSVINPNRKGILTVPYDAAFKKHHQLCLSILKKFGFGQRVMETRILMEVEEMISRVREQKGRPFDVQQLTTSCVANVIMNMLFGRRFDHDDTKFQQLISDIGGVTTEFSFTLGAFPYLRILPYFKKKIARLMTTSKSIDGFLNTNIAACLEGGEESFVSYFVESLGPDYDKEQLSHTTRELVGAGMDTTATTLCWAVVLLTNNLEVQERCQKEIDSVIGRQRLPALEDRSRLPYVEAAILEVMRNKTLVPTVLHKTLEDTEVDGYTIPRGTTVMVNLYSVHMDPAEWSQPEQFRPERFLDESGNVVGRELIAPFGLGKRSCLGEQLARQEIFLFLVSLLQNFHFKPAEGQETIDVQEVWGLTNSPSPYKVRLVARDQE